MASLAGSSWKFVFVFYSAASSGEGTSDSAVDSNFGRLERVDVFYVIKHRLYVRRSGLFGQPQARYTLTGM